jgi:hypothetical protein
VPNLQVFQDVEFPAVSPDTIQFLSMGAQSERSAKEFLPAGEAIDKLTQLHKEYIRRLSGKDPKPVRYAPAPDNRRFLSAKLHFAMLYHNYLVSRYLVLQRDFERWSVGLTDTLLSFLAATRRNTEFEARCSTSKLNAHVIASYGKRPFKALQEKVERMVPRFPTFEYTDPYLKAVLLRIVPLVNTTVDWVPFNDFDSEFAIFVGCTGLAPALAKLAYGLNGGNKSSVISYVKAFGKRVELKSTPGSVQAVSDLSGHMSRLFDRVRCRSPMRSADSAESDICCNRSPEHPFLMVASAGGHDRAKKGPRSAGAVGVSIARSIANGRGGTPSPLSGK